MRSHSLYLCLFRVFHETPVDLRAFSNSNSYLADSVHVCKVGKRKSAHTHTHTNRGREIHTPPILMDELLPLCLQQQ